MIDMAAVHRNRTSGLLYCKCLVRYSLTVNLAIYWGADANEFKPERFVDTDTYRWPRDACKQFSVLSVQYMRMLTWSQVLAFSTGFRDCIGRRFAAVEGANVIARIIRRYEILVPKRLRDMPFEEQKAYLSKWRPFVTNSPVYPEVTFRRRS